MYKIAVIEDHIEMRENISEILELANYEVVVAENGKKGVDLIRKETPDLVICDIMMPELDGYSVLYYLSKSPETATIPFIFLSAKAEQADLRKGMSLGADDYLTKPFKEIELLHAIETRLKKSKAIKQAQSASKTVNEFLDVQYKTQNISELAKKAKTKDLDRKELLFYAGDKPNYIYYILQGKVRTYKVNNQDKELVTALYNTGDYFGYLELLQDERYQEYAAALEDTKLALIAKDEFYNFILSNREVAASFMNVLAKSVSEKEEDLLQMAYDTVRKRVANALVKLHDKYNESNKQHFEMTISRDELASIVGTATESVIRVLSEFKTDGWIHVRGSQIEIIDIEPLRVYRF